MRTSTSDGPRPAMAKAREPDTTPGVTVRSGIWLMTMWSVAVAAPKTYTGGLRSVLARSALVMTKAPAPSVTRQQSRRWSGLVWSGEARTSSMVMGSWYLARGFLEAQSLVETAIWASCSDV